MKNFIKNSVFFVKTSRTYIAPWKLKDYLYLPIAFIKFHIIMKNG